MKKKFTIFITFTLFTSVVFAQGLRFDDSSYFNRAKLPKTRATLKTKSDLSLYTPVSYPQFGGTCVAHSFSKAITILECKKYGYTDPPKIIQNSFSPYFIYYNLSPTTDYKCSAGLDIEQAANFCLNIGQVKLLEVEYPNYYPFSTSFLGDLYPNQYPYSLADDKVMAKLHQFGSLYRADDIISVKAALSQGMPVVGGFMIPESFQLCKTDLFHWKGDGTKYGHAMVIVGYDDYKYGGAIKVANSWGKDWGLDGFAWVPYEIADAMLVRGYACSLESDIFQSPNNSFTPSLNKEYTEIITDLKNQNNTPSLKPTEINFGVGVNQSKTSFNPAEYLELAEKK
jgi:hypothetical protein